MSEDSLMEQRRRIKEAIPVSDRLMRCAMDPLGYWLRQLDEAAVEEIVHIFKRRRASRSEDDGL